LSDCCGLASLGNGRFSQYFRHLLVVPSSAPRETIDVEAMQPPPRRRRRRHRCESRCVAVAEPPQIIDLTALDASDSDENAMRPHLCKRLISLSMMTMMMMLPRRST
jgi:hypothetical protein